MSVPNQKATGSGGFTASASPGIAIGTVAVGDAATLGVAITGSGAVTINTISDNLGNLWSLLASIANSGRVAALYGAPITVGGSCTVTLGLSTSKSGRLGYNVWDNVAASPFSASADANVNSATTTHYAATGSGLSPSDPDLAAVCVFAYNSDLSPYTPQNSFNDGPTGSTLTEFTWKTAASFTNERGQVNSAGSGTGVGAIAFVKGLVAAGGGPFPHFNRRLLTGGLIELRGGLA